MDVKNVLMIYDYFMFNEDNSDMKAPEKVGWATKFDQDVRFKILLDIGVKQNDKILDWGCGLGHLIDYMNEHNYGVVDYNGIDINENTITLFKERYPNHKGECKTINELTETYDWILASGVFSFGVDLEDLIRDVDIAYQHVEKGLAFNCLLPLPEFVGAGFSVYNPKEVFELLSDKYSNVSLVEGYTHDDFTIYIKKEELYEQ